MKKEVLISLGLSRREAEAYYVLLGTDDALASEISEKTGESRTNTYDTLNSLIKKGLVSYVIKDKSKYFMSTSPKNLLKWMDLRKEELEKEKSNVESLIPELLKMKLPKEKKAQVEVYEGKEGWRTALNRTIQDATEGKTEILILSALSGEIRKMDPIYQEKYYKEKKAKGIHTRYLVTEGSSFPKSPNAEYRFLPNSFKSVVATSIHGNSVIFWLLTNPLIAVIVKSKELAESQRSNFEEFWKMAKK